MCNFFSCIITKTGDVLFTENDSHEEVITRSGLTDNLEGFVRVEYTKEEGYHIDEGLIPEWYERLASKAKGSVIAKYNLVLPAKTKYNKMEKQAWREYRKVEELALREFKKVQEPAWREHRKVEEPAWREHRKVEEPAWREYRKVKELALREFKKDIAEVPGYVKI